MNILQKSALLVVTTSAIGVIGLTTAARVSALTESSDTNDGTSTTQTATETIGDSSAATIDTTATAVSSTADEVDQSEDTATSTDENAKNNHNCDSEGGGSPPSTSQ